MDFNEKSREHFLKYLIRKNAKAVWSQSLKAMQKEWDKKDAKRFKNNQKVLFDSAGNVIEAGVKRDEMNAQAEKMINNQKK